MTAKEELTKLLMESYDRGLADATQLAVVAIEKAMLLEREACAKLCDAVAQQMDDEGEGPTGYIGWVDKCAAEIRARGNT
jgi:hypothetical protein